MRSFGGSLFASLAFSLSPLSLRAHKLLLVSDGPQMQGLVLEVLAAFSFRF